MENNFQLINNSKVTMYSELKRNLSQCESFIFSVAFINFAGLQLLLNHLKDLKERGISGKILTSTYLNFTEPSALRKLKSFSNIETKIFHSDNLGFHKKVYIFQYKDYYKVYIGSSNITPSALKKNIEWNIKATIARNEKSDILEEFYKLWNSKEAFSLSEDFLIQYEKRYIRNKRVEIDFLESDEVSPNYMQEKAVNALLKLKEIGERKALVVASTGSGKTYMSAFFIKENEPFRILFLAHREDILRQSIETFKRVIPSKKDHMGLFTGNLKEEKNYLFATVQSMNNHYLHFHKNHFDYIVVDEAHHIYADSYQRLIEYFQPHFLLGMSATPERGDRNSIYHIFDDNIALDLRLSEALEKNLVLPFHYYGISDIKEIDYRDIDIDKEEDLAKKLMVNTRVDYIIEKINFYGNSGKKRRCLGFCVNILHAEYMKEKFFEKGYICVVLSNKDSVERRKMILNRLEDEFDPLEYIFTVDIFNEGVDIPSLNLVLMLRPTKSPVVFIQQLGRGVRKYHNKEFLTVLDFIGNHKRCYLVAFALLGSKIYDKDSINVAIMDDFSNMRDVHIYMDEIVKEAILEKIENENFNNFKYLKDEYLEFSKVKNKIPTLLDYLEEGAPDPIRYINYGKSYESFQRKIEKNIELSIQLEEVLKRLSNLLPIKRIYEFILLKLLVHDKNITFNQYFKELGKYLDNVNIETSIHSIRFLNWDFMSEKEKSNDSYRKFKLLNYCEEIGSIKDISISEEFYEVIKGEVNKERILNLLDYGIYKYLEEFGTKDYKTPHLKLYSTYSQFHTALLSNYDKSLSAFRGSGVLKNKDDYFLFATLHKEKWQRGVEHSNIFLDEAHITFVSKSSTSVDSESGKDLISSQERNKKLHLFIRKFEKVDGEIEPFIYLGEVVTCSYTGEKPINMVLKLKNPLPLNLQKEFEIKN